MISLVSHLYILYVSHQPEEKKKKKERYEIDLEEEDFHPSVKVEVEQQGDRPVRACRTQQGKIARNCQKPQHKILLIIHF